jgi:hypothetical protein
MDKTTFLDNIREWIAGIAFDVYLWASRMTEEEFIAAQERQARRLIEMEMAEADKEITTMSQEEIAKAVQDSAGMWRDHTDLEGLLDR